MPLQQIAKVICSKLTTIHYTTTAYELNGRTNKLLTLNAKQKLLDQRSQREEKLASIKAPKKLFEVTKAVLKNTAKLTANKPL